MSVQPASHAICRRTKTAAKLGVALSTVWLTAATYAAIGGAAGASGRSNAKSGPAPEVTSASPSDIPAGEAVVSPAPGTKTASVTTQISFLGNAASARKLHSITVTGSLSGAHTGRLENYAGAPGASFLPTKSFVAGETVSVRAPIGVVGAASGSFSFQIANASPVVGEVHHHYKTTGPNVRTFATWPGDAPSRVFVHPTGTTKGEGDLFVAPKGANGQPGPMILSPEGKLVWFHRLTDPNEYAMNFSEQHFAGKPVLAWWQGQIVAAHGRGEDVLMNQRYQTVAVIHGGNGFPADLHDLQVTGKTIWVTSYQAIHWNLTSVGGLADSLVWDGIVQEIDIPTGLVVFEWHSLDHVPVDWSYFESSPSPTGRLDYFHVNSIDVVSPNEIVVSSRNTSAFYDLSVSRGGAVRYVVGGKHSTYALGLGARFNLQHDVRVLPGGNVTIFDNNASPVYGQSKALTIHLDPATKQATLVQSITHQPALIGSALGNVETLSDHNLFVDWGTTQYFNEYSPNGALLYEGQFAGGDDSYRAYRFPWSATPALPPRAALTRTGATSGVLEASWNGATGVSSWQVLIGTRANASHVVATAKRSGFGTRIALRHLPAVGYVIVRAIAKSGAVLRSSVRTPIPSAPIPSQRSRARSELAAKRRNFRPATPQALPSYDRNDSSSSIQPASPVAAR